MSEKKVVRRSVAIALGIVCIILAVGIGGAIANYTSVISGKDNTISSRDSQISSLQTQNNQVQTWLDGNRTYYAAEIAGKDSQIATKDSQITNLQSSYNNYISNHHHTDSEYDQLTAPHLIGVNLDSDDIRPYWGTPYLRVFGDVINIGMDTAYNSVLYVEAFQGSVQAFNKTITVGTLSVGRYAHVDAPISYTGNALTTWHIWSQPYGIDWNWYP